MLVHTADKELGVADLQSDFSLFQEHVWRSISNKKLFFVVKWHGFFKAKVPLWTTDTPKTIVVNTARCPARV
jgi:hypothetical protein